MGFFFVFVFVFVRVRGESLELRGWQTYLRRCGERAKERSVDRKNLVWV